MINFKKSSEFNEEIADEEIEEYNEEIYKWLSIGLLVIWFFSILYL